MSQKIYSWILKGGIFLSLISLFLVNGKLLFPYISSKQLFFNGLIEILLIFWVALIVKYPEWRPKRSSITLGLLAFFSVLTISCFTGVDFNLSFWGDTERLLGVFHLLHFLAFYFILITVFRTWSDWKILLITSVVFASGIAIYGLAKDPMSKFGNTAYVSGYLIFNMYFCWLLFLREKDVILKWLYLIPLPIMLAAFKAADTSGAIVGLSFSILCLFFLYAVLSKNRKVKIVCGVLTALIIVSGLLFYQYKDSAFLNQFSFADNFKSISLQKNTFQTRLISWKAGLKHVKEDPFLGTGHGNYAIVFDKYFDPVFYTYTASETYFDRAHNNLIDIAVTTGILGLLAYLSIFVAAAYYLISGFVKKNISLHEFILISCLMIAYFVQNLAVFDSFATYISLMTFLAFVYWLSKSDQIIAGKVMGRTREASGQFSGQEVFALVVSTGFLAFVFYYATFMPYKMLVKTIEGQRELYASNFAQAYEVYNEALGSNTVLDRDSRSALVRTFSGSFGQAVKTDPASAKKLLDLSIESSKKNLEYNQHDSLAHLQMAIVYDLASSFYANDADKKKYYYDLAIEEVDKSITASPRRVTIFFTKGQIYLKAGETDKSLETLKYAYDLNPKYYDSSCHLSRVYLSLNKLEDGYKYMDICVDTGGSPTLNPADYVKAIISHYYENKDYKRMLPLLVQLSVLDNKNALVLVDLAKLYAQLGQKTQAINTANRIIKLDPAQKANVEEFIKSLE